MNISWPDLPSRFPTGSEIKKVIGELMGYEIKINDNGVGWIWQASIVHKCGGDNGPWAHLNISEYSGDEEQQKLWFEKGSPELNEEILRRLGKMCGPLVLIPDTGEKPQVITP